MLKQTGSRRSGASITIQLLFQVSMQTCDKLYIFVHTQEPYLILCATENVFPNESHHVFRLSFVIDFISNCCDLAACYTFYISKE